MDRPDGQDIVVCCGRFFLKRKTLPYRQNILLILSIHVNSQAGIALSHPFILQRCSG